MLEAFYGFGVASASDFETEQEERLGVDDSNEKDSIPKGLHATEFRVAFCSQCSMSSKVYTHVVLSESLSVFRKVLR